MQSPSAGIYSAAQVRALDRRAIDEFGLPGYELMTRAGHATLNALRAVWPAAQSIAVLCGPGNNGGDGYVVARIARAQGWRAVVVPLGDPGQMQGDARHAFDDFIAAGGTVTPWHPQLLQTVDVVVDALFGTGLTRPVEGAAAALIDAINTAQRPVVAVDIPSGLHADTGAALALATRADLTVTFIGRKAGFYLDAGPEHVGRTVFDDLAVPAGTYTDIPAVARLIDADLVAAALPRRERTAHKGRHGHVLVIGGAPGMSGAARLAGEAALRAGAGLVTVAVHPSGIAALASRPELMSVAIGTYADLSHALERATVIALGPGLGQSPWAMEIMASALAAGKPLVVDADALNLLAMNPLRRDDWILTPHPGEAARLLDLSTATVQQDRLLAAAALQERYGGTIALKGAGTIVQTPGDGAWLCDRGNPGMAVAGMGDVLTGTVAGIAAQCTDLALAARAGVHVHASAGDAAAAAGERGMLATDVIDRLRAQVNPPGGPAFTAAATPTANSSSTASADPP